MHDASFETTPLAIDRFGMRFAIAFAIGGSRTSFLAATFRVDHERTASVATLALDTRSVCVAVTHAVRG